jgi:MoxR-like ATPase
MALLRGRSYVTPDDVQAVARPVLSHRVQLTAQAKYGGMTPDAIVGGLLGQVPVPT